MESSRVAWFGSAEDITEIQSLLWGPRDPAKIAVVFDGSSPRKLVDAVVKAVGEHGLHAEEDGESTGRFSVEFTEEGLKKSLEEGGLRKRDLRGDVTELKKDTFIAGGVPPRSIISPAEELILLKKALYGIKRGQIDLETDQQQAPEGVDVLIPILLQSKVVTHFFPLHDDRKVNLILSQMSWRSPLPSFATLYQLSGYLGERSALYFGFFKYFIRWLLILAFAGTLCSFMAALAPLKYRAWLMILYTVFAVVWVGQFLDVWRRKNAEMMFLWSNTLPESTLEEFAIHHQVEDEFRDPLRPKRSKTVKTAIELSSWLLLFIYLALSCAALHWSLEVGVYTNPLMEKTAPEFVSETNALLVESVWRITRYNTLMYFPTILYIFFLNVFEQGYNRLATYVTQLERHKHERNYDNILFLRLMLYRLLCKNMSYFYLAFYQQLYRDLIEGLILITAFENMVLVLKQIVFFVGSIIQDRRKRSRIATAKKNDDASPPKTEIMEMMELKPQTASLDYARLASVFGQIALFAAALPAIAFAALFGNFFQLYVELRTALNSRRSFPRRALLIGSVYHAFKIVAMASVATNLFLVIFTAKFGDHINGDEIDSSKEFFFVFVIENVLLFVKYILSARTKAVPKWIKADLLKPRYAKEYEGFATVATQEDSSAGESL